MRGLDPRICFPSCGRIAFLCMPVPVTTPKIARHFLSPGLKIATVSSYAA
jgi:hypothetical protein